MRPFFDRYDLEFCGTGSHIRISAPDASFVSLCWLLVTEFLIYDKSENCICALVIHSIIAQSMLSASASLSPCRAASRFPLVIDCSRSLISYRRCSKRERNGTKRNRKRKRVQQYEYTNTACFSFEIATSRTSARACVLPCASADPPSSSTSASTSTSREAFAL